MTWTVIEKGSTGRGNGPWARVTMQGRQPFLFLNTSASKLFPSQGCVLLKNEKGLALREPHEGEAFRRISASRISVGGVEGLTVGDRFSLVQQDGAWLLQPMQPTK